MDHAIAMNQLKALGLKVTKMGRISDSDVDYGILLPQDLKTIDGRVMPLDDIDYFRWVDTDHTLFAMKDEDDAYGGEKIRGDHFSTQDVTDIELRKMPKAVSKLIDVMPELYPMIDKYAYYDELNEKDMIDMSLFGDPEGGLKMMDDQIFAVFTNDLEHKLDRAGFIGNSYPSKDIKIQTLDYYMYKNRRNLFREWVESHEWDGKPRVRTWFQRLFGATAPPLREQGLEDRYLGDVSEMWFVGVVRRQYLETKHEIVPVLISEQGIGKGNALQLMAGQDCWYREFTGDVRNTKDCLDELRGAIVVELSEAQQIKNGDQEALKAFISKSSDHVRKAYARYDGTYPRHFGLIATSNHETIFTDTTGNRRYFPMFCDGENSDYVTREDIEQVWAEALVMFRDGHRWYTTEEVADIAAIMQDFGTEENLNISAIDQWLSDPMNGYAKIGSKISKEDILENVFSVAPGTIKSMIPTEVTRVFKQWASSTREWKMFAGTARVGKKVIRGYERVALPGEKYTVTRLKMASGLPKAKVKDPVNVMREVCMANGCTNPGDAFPANVLSKDQLHTLMAEGYIYQLGVGPDAEYKVGMMP